MSFSKTMVAAFVMTLGFALTAPAMAQVARPSDRAVENLIEQMKKSEQQFEKALDRNIKRATVRSADGEMDMQASLKDFNTAIDRLKDRFRPDYSASSELLSVMRRAGDLDNFIKGQPPTLKGRSEWDSYAASLNQLAMAYGSTFPMAADDPPRRINDREVEQAADNTVKQAQALQRTAGDPKAVRSDLDALSKAAKTLKSRVSSGKPASGEAAAYQQAYEKVKASVGSQTLSAKAQPAYDALVAAAAKVEQAFNMS